MKFLPTLQQLYAAILLIAAPIVASALTLIVLQLDRISKLPPDLPWVDLRGERWFPKLRANFHQIVTGRQPISEGWEKRSEKRCGTPNMANPSSSQDSTGRRSYFQHPTMPGSPANPNTFSATTLSKTSY
ncbi:hypothetical protein KC332_g8263 [Hortaea werneckii]|nr:hypothetical protein KC358_g3434 [Hortaea werneckii]KAI6850626.1 hypothetical protein KC350_g2051 [Hortaea werneckii]KAI6929540.1 hypothetical protein KC341_g10795 [Hortaea werneckii]KAI6947468.1 hypothetical protein KC348_g2532 [Hortaea werneckii]KAI6968229.1 hypothetical protein KC321_g8589 [Hortaea werneckii]